MLHICLSIDRVLGFMKSPRTAKSRISHIHEFRSLVWFAAEAWLDQRGDLHLLEVFLVFSLL